MGFGFAADVGEAAGAGNQPEQPELEREAGIHRFLRRRLAGLVIDDRQPAVGQAVDAVGLAVDNDRGDLGLAR